MPADLLSLKEQLQNLQVILEGALKHGRDNEILSKLREQITIVQTKIIIEKKV